MNTLLFLCGAGVGALIATLLLILAIGLLRRGMDAKDKLMDAKADEMRCQTNHHMTRQTILLTERNKIGEQQVKALETLAQWAEANWKADR